MIAAEETALVLLAAGASSRFPGGNKLEADFLGRPVGLHVVTALAAMPFRARFAIVDGSALDFAGYTVVRNDGREPGMAASVKLGVAAARDVAAAAVMIVLADMPRVTATHLYRMLDAAETPGAVVASSDGTRPRPPALFGADRFDELLRLTGDAGARDLIRGGRHVVAGPGELVDIDTPDDLERLRASIRGAARRLD